MSHNDSVYVAKREFYDSRFGMVVSGQEITSISDHAAKEMISANLIAIKEKPESVADDVQDDISVNSKAKETPQADAPKAAPVKPTKKEKVNASR